MCRVKVVVVKMIASKANQHHYEHLLFGCVTEGELQPLLHRLRGLCDYATTGGVPFLEREVGYKIGRDHFSGSFTSLFFYFISIEAGNAITRVKVRQSLDAPEAPW